MVDVSCYAKAAARYRPQKVKLLWIAESPPPVRPGEEPRYFYFEQMSRHDSLFREVMRAMFPGAHIPSEGERKTELLCRFRDCGAFLIDVCEKPSTYSYDLGWEVAEQKLRDLDPEHIVAVKADVCCFVYPRLRAMGLGDRLLTDRVVPFPGSGQQTRFHELADPITREWMSRLCSRDNRGHRA